MSRLIEQIIEEEFQKQGITHDKMCTSEDMFKVMIGCGLYYHYKSFDSWRGGFFHFHVRKKHMILPDIPRTGKVQKFYFTGKMLKNILVQFLPGGKMHYDYREDSDAAAFNQAQGVSVQEENVPQDSHEQDNNFTPQALSV